MESQKLAGKARRKIGFKALFGLLYIEVSEVVTTRKSVINHVIVKCFLSSSGK